MKSLSFKVVVLCIGVFGMAGSAFSGDTASGMELSAGARLGLSVSSILGDTVQGMTPRIGFNLCLYSTQWLSAKLGFQEELMIGTKGAAWKSGQDEYTQLVYEHFATSLTYLDIPLMVKWRFLANDALRPSILLGPDFAFPLIADADFQGTTKDMKNETNGFDFGITAGLSVDIRKGNMFIPVDIRYTLGLVNFAKATNDYTANVKNGVFSISAGLGFLLDFKKKEGEF